MNSMKTSQQNLHDMQCKLLQMVNQQKSVIYKLKETYKQIKNSNISLDSLNRQKDQDIEDLRRAMISMELSSQKQSLKDTDLINDLRLNLSSKDSQILALEESITLLKKDKITLRRMLSKLYQHYEIIQDGANKVKNKEITEAISNRDESYYKKFLTSKEGANGANEKKDDVRKPNSSIRTLKDCNNEQQLPLNAVETQKNGHQVLNAVEGSKNGLEVPNNMPSKKRAIVKQGDGNPSTSDIQQVPNAVPSNARAILKQGDGNPFTSDIQQVPNAVPSNARAILKQGDGNPFTSDMKLENGKVSIMKRPPSSHHPKAV